MNSSILDLCQIGNIVEIEKHLNKGICPNYQNSEGESPLQVAAAYGYTNIAALLLKHGAQVDLANNYGWTPLMHAARYGHISTVTFLLKMKAKVNICSKLGVSPVIAAAWSGSIATLKLLVEAGAMIDLMSSDNESNECDLSTLMVASLNGYEDVLSFLLETGADIQQTSPITGLSPLMLAACEGHFKIVKIIVDYGGDPNNIDICGRSALDHAIECNKEEVVTYLKNISVPNPKNDVQHYGNMPVVRIDSPDISPIEPSVSIRTPGELVAKKGFTFSTQALENTKFSFSDRLHSKRSHHETKVKEWIGGVAQHLQQKVFTHMSSRNSQKSPTFDISFSEEAANDVFEIQKTEESTLGDLKPSISLSPDQYLASELKEHAIEAITPPFPTSSYSKLIWNFRTKKENMDDKQKRSLQLPKLLKNYSRKKSSVCSTKHGVQNITVYSERCEKEYLDEASLTTSARAEHLHYLPIKTDHGKVLKGSKANNDNTGELFTASNDLVDDANVNISQGDLTVLLGKESLQKYADKFHDQEVDINTFQQLTKDDLVDIGIESSGSQKKLIALIKKLQSST